MIKLARLKSQLNTSGVQNTNPALYQVIIQLIEFLQKILLELEGEVTTTGTSSTTGLAALAALITLIKNSDLLTHSDESVDFPNSRELLAGTGITFDDATPNQRTIDSSAVDLTSFDFLTHSDESATLINSRQLLAGTGVTFDDTIANARTINSSGMDRQWSVLTDGDILETELIFAGGEVVMTSIP